MERINYLKRGQIAYFIQDYNLFGKERFECYSMENFDLEQFPDSVGAGKVARSLMGVRIWNSSDIDAKINSGHIERYLSRKKFVNLKIVK